MSANFGWTGISSKEIAGLQNALLNRNVRDEIGFLAFHYSYADRFFPGSSTLHRGAKYAFWIPWMFEQIKLGNSASLAAADNKLFQHLKKAKNPSQTPIPPEGQPCYSSYWTALKTWGLLCENAPPRHQIEALARSWQTEKRGDFNSANKWQEEAWPFASTPNRHSSINEVAPLEDPFLLDGAEKKWLRERLEETRDNQGNPSLLSRLVRAAKPGNVDFGEAHFSSLKTIFPQNVELDPFRPFLVRAEQAASLVGIGRCYYAQFALEANKSVNIPVAQEEFDSIAKTLDKYKMLIANMSEGQLEQIWEDCGSALFPDMKKLSQCLLRSIHTDQRVEIYQWMQKIESSRKGSRTRLGKNAASENFLRSRPTHFYNLEQIHFRWFQVRQILQDVSHD